MSRDLKNILVIRNDKLGDFTLSLPSFALLKASLPDTRLCALVPDYTREVAELCPAIDDILLDPGVGAEHTKQRALIQTLAKQKFDAALTLYSTARIGWTLLRSAIPERFAPATKLAQVFYNHRIRQRRSQSLKPEYQYNLDLVERLLVYFGYRPAAPPKAPYFRLEQETVQQTRNQFYLHQQLDPAGLSVFVHPGHGGSANNLSSDQYADLVNRLEHTRPLNIIVSAGPGEFDQAAYVKQKIVRHKTCVYESREGLARFVYHIAFADLFISGSTGPLHVAGALNRATCGFYPNRRSATSLRWQTLSSDDRRLAFSPPPQAGEEDMGQIDLTAAAARINDFIASFYP